MRSVNSNSSQSKIISELNQSVSTQSKSLNSTKVSEHNLENIVDENNKKEDINDLLVHTSGGRVFGKEVMISTGAVVKEYLGIPYAKPPLGDLRFKPPQPPLMWNDVRKAITEQPRCWNSFASNSWEVGTSVRKHTY